MRRSNQLKSSLLDPCLVSTIRFMQVSTGPSEHKPWMLLELTQALDFHTDMNFDIAILASRERTAAPPTSHVVYASSSLMCPGHLISESSEIHS